MGAGLPANGCRQVKCLQADGKAFAAKAAPTIWPLPRFELFRQFALHLLRIFHVVIPVLGALF